MQTAKQSKGGEIKLSSIGTFDNLNPYILKGVAAWQTVYLFETLMKSSFDEPFSQYGLLAEGVKVPNDRSWVSFKLRKEAKFSDGSKVLPEDVIFFLLIYLFPKDIQYIKHTTAKLIKL